MIHNVKGSVGYGVQNASRDSEHETKTNEHEFVDVSGFSAKYCSCEGVNGLWQNDVTTGLNKKRLPIDDDRGSCPPGYHRGPADGCVKDKEDKCSCPCCCPKPLPKPDPCGPTAHPVDPEQCK